MAEISWDQLQSVIQSLQEVNKSSKKLYESYIRHHVEINNRINSLTKLNNDLQHLTSSACRRIDGELTRLRAIRAEQNALKRPDPKPVQQNPVRPKSKPGAKRPAKRIDGAG